MLLVHTLSKIPLETKILCSQATVCGLLQLPLDISGKRKSLPLKSLLLCAPHDAHRYDGRTADKRTTNWQLTATGTKLLLFDLLDFGDLVERVGFEPT